MIGVMVPSVFAQIEVTVTPYKESHHIDEPNYVTVELSKVVPNTDLCYEIIQNNDIQFTKEYRNPGNSNRIDIPYAELDAGNYTVRVFYGACNLENSFGNNSAQIIFDKEPSDLAKFIQENYFPEQMDVGLNFNGQPFTYSPEFLNINSNVYQVANIENAIVQVVQGKGEWFFVMVYKIDLLGSSKITFNGNDLPYEMILEQEKFLPFDCNYNKNPRVEQNSKIFPRSEMVNCMYDDVVVQILGYDTATSQETLFVKVVTQKINSNPIPSDFSSDNFTPSELSEEISSISIIDNECGEGTVLKNNVCVLEISCGKGTIEQNGQCVAEQESSKGGGCLIATATYGSEMSQQVQQLRELRDNQLLQTESGTAFMSTFNDVYYSFSPIIADYERENPYFKEAVKLAITPMISSLLLMENAESESEVLGLGLSVIALNLGMYLAVPTIVLVGIRKSIF